MKIKFSRLKTPFRRQLCRLCVSYGYDRKDILDYAPDNATELNEKIFRCVGIRVSAISCLFTVQVNIIVNHLHHFQIDMNDLTTKRICQTCFEKINEFDRFRELCVTSQRNVRMLSGLPNEDGESSVDVTADPCDTESSTAEDTSSSIEVSSVISDDNETSLSTGTHDDIASIGADT